MSEAVDVRSFLERAFLILGQLDEFGKECGFAAGIVLGNAFQLKDV